jgi:hypothetical protein
MALTRADAYAQLQAAYEDQCELAEREGTPPNAAARNDERTRRLAYTLLQALDLRRLFAWFVTDQRRLPRVRALFGPPPFYFLDHGDGDLLQASGFAAGRARMAYDRVTPPQTQFGLGQYVDEAQRQYKELRPEARVADAPHASQALAITRPEELDDRLVVLVMRRARRRAARAADANASAARFPFVGEVVRLRPSEHGKRALGAEAGSSEVRLRVLSVTFDHPSARVARMQCARH